MKTATLARKPRALAKPRDAEAIAVLINLLGRYAHDAPNKTALDHRVEQAFDAWAIGRLVAQRLVRRFEAMPIAIRQDLLGTDNADATRTLIPEARQLTAVARLRELNLPPRPAPAEDGDGVYRHLPLEPMGTLNVPVPLPQGGARVSRAPSQLFYRGLFCIEETDFDRFTGSDEIFVITNVIYQVGDQNKVRTEKHPIDTAEYEGIDSGEWRRGPTALCWTNPARRPIGLAVHVLESDDQNPQEYKDEIRAVVSVAAGVLSATVPASSAIVMNSGFQDAVTTLIQFLLASGADLIGDAYVDLSVEEIRRFESTPPRVGRRSRIPYHFRTSHVGEGARYSVYFTMGR